MQGREEPRSGTRQSLKRVLGVATVTSMDTLSSSAVLWPTPSSSPGLWTEGATPNLKKGPGKPL